MPQVEKIGDCGMLSADWLRRPVRGKSLTYRITAGFKCTRG